MGKRKLEQNSEDEPKAKRKALSRTDTVELPRVETTPGISRKTSSAVLAAVEEVDPVLSVQDREKLREKLSSILKTTSCMLQLTFLYLFFLLHYSVSFSYGGHLR